MVSDPGQVRGRERVARSLLESVVVVGTTWREGGVEVLSRYTVKEEERARRLRHLAERLRAEELIYLATCNRVEVIMTIGQEVDRAQLATLVQTELSGGEPSPAEAARAFSVVTGASAVEHLCRLAAGLDSAQLGEREILGQIRGALERAEELGLCGARLGTVVTEAIRIARRVHLRTQVGSGSLSLAQIGLDHLLKRLRQTPGRVALVGVSTMTRACARSLSAQGIETVIVNRTVAKAMALAEEVGGQAQELSLFCRQPIPVEGVLTATSAFEPLLGGLELERLIAAAPSGLAPVVVGHASATLYYG